MPEISRFYGIAVTMYVADQEPPHFHARYDQHKAVIRVADGELTEGDLPERALQFVAEWYADHAQDLTAAWDKAKAGKDPGTIAPLE